MQQYKALIEKMAGSKLKNLVINDDPNTVHLIPTSGGADSSCCAIVLMSLFPYINFRLVFTDTGDEDQELYQRLDDLESIFSCKIDRVTDNGETLYSLIDKYNGFLPSSGARFCTKSLKIKPLDKWMKESFTQNEKVISYVGIRADEDRFGMVSDNDAVSAVFPLTKLGFGKQEVFEILDKTIGLPLVYRRRTRSGCSSCFYQANHELLQFFINDPKKWERSKGYETFSEEDTVRFGKLSEQFENEFLPAYKTLHPAHACYPVPPAVDVRHKNGSLDYQPPKAKFEKTLDNKEQQGLFDEPINPEEEYSSYFVAVAYLADPMINLFGKQEGPGVYNQHIISFAKTFNGLKRSMSFYFKHRLSTAQVWHESTQSIQSNLKIGIFRIELPSRLVDFGKTGKGSFAWKTDTTYTQLEHHFKMAHVILSKGSLEQQMDELKKYAPTPDRVDAYRHLLKKWKKLKSAPGFITWAGEVNMENISKSSNNGFETGQNQNELFDSCAAKPVAKKRTIDPEDNSLICVICDL